MKAPPKIAFDKAARYLIALQAGKGQKEAAHEAGLSRPHPALIREMFPLFLGLKRKYTKNEEPEE